MVDQLLGGDVDVLQLRQEQHGTDSHQAQVSREVQTQHEESAAPLSPHSTEGCIHHQQRHRYNEPCHYHKNGMRELTRCGRNLVSQSSRASL